jgi:hypothetical protein
MPANKKPSSSGKKKEKNAPVDPFSPGKPDDSHLGSSNAFEETEDPGSPDPDDITDEKLDEWLNE